MKKNLSTHLIVLICITLLFSACNNDSSSDEINIQQAAISEDDIQLFDEGELINEEISGIVENTVLNGEVNAIAGVPFNGNFLPECASVNTELTNTTITRTIVFSENCELPTGNIISGTIEIQLERNFEKLERSISYTLDNIVFNDVAVSGSSSLTRTRFNDNGNPQSISNTSFEVTWPDGTSASFSGNRIRELIEGANTPQRLDNVILISGERSFTNRNGVSFESEITETLRREFSCRFIVSGLIELSRGDATASLDFGDGNCDNTGVFTNTNGDSREINLRRFR